MKSFLVNLTQEMHANVKFLSFKKGGTMTSFVIEAIEDKIKKEESVLGDRGVDGH